MKSQIRRTPLQCVGVGIGLSDPKACVDTIRALVVRGQNDPMHQDVWGDSLLTDYLGHSEGYLWLLNQEEFQVDILQAGGRPLHVIAACLACTFALDVTCSPSRKWEPALRRLLQLGISPISKDLGTGTPLDSLLMCVDHQFESGPVAQEWLSLLSSVGVDIEDYVSVEKRLHISGLVQHYSPFWHQTVLRNIIFEETGIPTQQSIRWVWLYGHESPADLVLTEFLTFSELFHQHTGNWQCTWPFIYVEAHKALGVGSSSLTKENIRRNAEVRWERQAARRQRRTELSSGFVKISRSEKRLRLPGSLVEDRMPNSLTGQRRRSILGILWWFYLFAMGILSLKLGTDFLSP
jgi:hypothetical protein